MKDKEENLEEAKGDKEEKETKEYPLPPYDPIEEEIYTEMFETEPFRKWAPFSTVELKVEARKRGKKLDEKIYAYSDEISKKIMRLHQNLKNLLDNGVINPALENEEFRNILTSFLDCRRLLSNVWFAIFCRDYLDNHSKKIKTKLLNGEIVEPFGNVHEYFYKYAKNHEQIDNGNFPLSSQEIKRILSIKLSNKNEYDEDIEKLGIILQPKLESFILKPRKFAEQCCKFLDMQKEPILALWLGKNNYSRSPQSITKYGKNWSEVREHFSVNRRSMKKEYTNFSRAFTAIKDSTRF